MATSFRLWTPVANALEAYRRRVLRDPKATYEHIWRLIHIHEALVVTVGAALASRLLSQWSDDASALINLNRLRSLVTGMPERDDEGLSQSPPSEFCFGGSIKAWIDLLQVFGKSEMLPSCQFCNQLGAYLRAEHPQNQLAFLDSWRRIAPVPSNYSGNLPRVMRFDAINSLRNKLAHVPMPERVLLDLHRGLRSEVLLSLSPKYDPNQDDVAADFRSTQWHPPLCGRILMRGFFLTGSDMGRDNAACDSQDEQVRIQPGAQNDEEPSTPWSAEPFFFVDSECKVSLLFRIPEIDLLSDSFPAEYHRFAAEFEPVHRARVSSTMIHPWIPKPPPAEPTPQPDVPAPEGDGPPGQPATVVEVAPEPTYELKGNETPQDLRTLAEDAFRHRKYHAAVAAFNALAKTGDFRYNDVARSKHGGALWRSAILDQEESLNAKTAKIEEALRLLKQASHHIDPRYQARAFYESSKAQYHLWKLSGDETSLQKALAAAREAAQTDYEVAYITWLERIADER